MSALTGLHVPHCNAKCRGEWHWLHDTITGHAHGPECRKTCAACVEEPQETSHRRPRSWI